jgi:hypothetical protein
MTWRVARSLDVLLAEINTAAPDRNKISDGSIGDASHATRDSDHNPFVIDSNGIGVVRARDFTNDPAGGFDCNDFAPRVAALMRDHPALGPGAYVIWNRRIWSCDRDNEGWRAYTGSNPHEHHCHVSVALAADGYDSSAPWGVMGELDDMANYADQLDEIQRAITDLAKATATLTVLVDDRVRAGSYKRDDRADDKLDEILAAIKAQP